MVEVKMHALDWPSQLPSGITYIFFSPGATTPIGGCILQPSSGL